MRYRVANAAPREIELQFENIFSELLDVIVLRFRQVPQQQVSVYVVIRELGGDLLTDKSVGKLRNFTATIDSVVISESDKGHPPFFKPLIQFFGVRIAVGEFESPKNPLCGAITEFRVNMEIDFRGHVVVQKLVSCLRNSMHFVAIKMACAISELSARSRVHKGYILSPHEPL